MTSRTAAISRNLVLAIGLLGGSLMVWRQWLSLVHWPLAVSCGLLVLLVLKPAELLMGPPLSQASCIQSLPDWLSPSEASASECALPKSSEMPQPKSVTPIGRSLLGLNQNLSDTLRLKTSIPAENE